MQCSDAKILENICERDFSSRLFRGLKFIKIRKDATQVILKLADLTTAESLIEQSYHFVRYTLIHCPHVSILLYQADDNFPPVFAGYLASQIPRIRKSIQHARKCGFSQGRFLRKLLDRDAVSLPKYEKDPALGRTNLGEIVLRQNLRKYPLRQQLHLGYQKTALPNFCHAVPFRYPPHLNPLPIGERAG